MSFLGAVYVHALPHARCRDAPNARSGEPCRGIALEFAVDDGFGPVGSVGGIAEVGPQHADWQGLVAGRWRRGWWYESAASRRLEGRAGWRSVAFLRVTCLFHIGW